MNKLCHWNDLSTALRFGLCWTGLRTRSLEAREMLAHATRSIYELGFARRSKDKRTMRHVKRSYTIRDDAALLIMRWHYALHVARLSVCLSHSCPYAGRKSFVENQQWRCQLATGRAVWGLEGQTSRSQSQNLSCVQPSWLTNREQNDVESPNLVRIVYINGNSWCQLNVNRSWRMNAILKVLSHMPCQWSGPYMSVLLFAASYQYIGSMRDVNARHQQLLSCSQY